MNENFTPPEPLNTAVLFLVFNRPDATAQVFEAIRQARPPRLYVAADGPRVGREGEAGRVAAVREIATAVDWPCEVKTLFRDKNLGCKYAVSGAITWFFEQEKQGIILEDDCLPHPEFFRFCEAMLERYERDERVWMITGNNFQGGRRRGDASYYFSKYSHIWGWATWRRAWSQYDAEIQFWPEWRDSDDWIAAVPDAVERRYWTKILNTEYSGGVDTWDYQWQAVLFRNRGLSVVPNVNLVSNIGFGSSATHTTSEKSPFANLHGEALGEISHCETVVRNPDADRHDFDFRFDGRSQRFPHSLLRVPRRIIGFPYRRLKRSISWCISAVRG